MKYVYMLLCYRLGVARVVGAPRVCVCVTAAALGGVPVSVYVCQISGQHFAVTADPTSKRK